MCCSPRSHRVRYDLATEQVCIISSICYLKTLKKHLFNLKKYFHIYKASRWLLLYYYYNNYNWCKQKPIIRTFSETDKWKFVHPKEKGEINWGILQWTSYLAKQNKTKTNYWFSNRMNESQRVWIIEK